MSKMIFDKKKKENKKSDETFKPKLKLPPKNAEVIQGVLSKHKRGFGFVTPIFNEEENDVNEKNMQDIFIAGKNLNGAMNGDTVSVILFPASNDNKSREGIVDKIIIHGVKEIIGTFQKNKSFGFVVPDDKHFNNEDVFVKKNDWKNAETGDKVVVEITKYPEDGNSAEGKITEVISRFGETGGDIKALIRQYNLFQTFPSRVNAEAKAVSKVKLLAEGIAPITEEEYKGRVDLRDKKIITIDGADAKDLDDAISIEKLPNGNYRLGVHIADVSHYVTEDGPMDKEALKRGTSVYLVDQVIPMLPKALSNGICSLNPDVDRLTLSVTMEIDSTGEVANHDVYKSVIHSAHRMVYDDVSDMIEENAVDLISKYDDIYKDILLMKELADILHKKRDLRGSLDFDFDEAYITLDEAGIPITVETAERRVANRIIEEFMLIANETIAEHFYWLETPFVYRVHEKPAPDRMDEFKNFVRGFGISMKGNTENIHPRVLSDMLKEVKGQSYENVVNTVMLRSMKKAFYDVSCDGHFGLGVKFYCHFTSPIRRYPDLIIHRIIKEVIDGNISDKRIKQLKKRVDIASELSSKAERHAQELEREVEKLKKTEYMLYHIGECFEGVISGVTNYGFYVELPNTIEGLVRIESLIDDYYDYEQAKYRFIGQRTNKIYGLGDKVKIQVSRANVDDREIDFIIAEE